MQPDVLEHAARVLDREPTRTLKADVLYRRTTRAVGADMSLPRFVECLSARPDQFAVLPANTALMERTAWNARDRSRYDPALRDAGAALPLIALAERGPDPNDWLPSPSTDSETSILGDAHTALARILANAADDRLRAAAADAIEELHAVSRALSP